MRWSIDLRYVVPEAAAARSDEERQGYATSHLLQVDHLLPVSQGGSDPDNLRLACFAHHRMRHCGRPAP